MGRRMLTFELLKARAYSPSFWTKETFTYLTHYWKPGPGTLLSARLCHVSPKVFQSSFHCVPVLWTRESAFFTGLPGDPQLLKWISWTGEGGLWFYKKLISGFSSQYPSKKPCSMKVLNRILTSEQASKLVRETFAAHTGACTEAERRDYQDSAHRCGAGQGRSWSLNPPFLVGIPHPTSCWPWYTPSVLCSETGRVESKRALGKNGRCLHLDF